MGLSFEKGLMLNLWRFCLQYIWEAEEGRRDSVTGSPESVSLGFLLSNVMGLVSGVTFYLHIGVYLFFKYSLVSISIGKSDSAR